MRLLRLKALSAVAMLALGVAAAAPAAAQTYRMNLADAYPPTEVINLNLKQWNEEIRKTTNGQVQINLHLTGSLFKNPEIKRAVPTGQVEFGTQLMLNLGPEKRLFEIDGLPFQVRNQEEAIKLWELSREPLSKYMLSQGMRLLYATPWPSQGFFFKKEVNSLADIAGLRQRSHNETAAQLAKYMGTVPTTVQITEVPQAMLTGMIQCFNTATPTGVIFKAWEYTTHFYDTKAFYGKQMVFVNEAAFRKLPAGAQQAILQASKNAEARGWKLIVEQEEIAKKTLREHGLKVLDPSPKLQAELMNIGEQMRKDWLEKADAESKAVFAQYLKATGRQ